MTFSFILMDRADATRIAQWRYEGEYEVYSFSADEETIAELLDRRSPYYAVHDEEGELVGYFVCGTAATVADTDEPRLFVEPGTLPIGLGLRPDLVGKGLGVQFVRACLEFARPMFTPERFCLYVLSWNKRALKIYERAGFHAARTFLQENKHGESEFIEMVRSARL
uniref:N-acetyltransferase n=1 Tax=Thermosporothrix sp. COM3 TaxID=2490863 RepID=A0A455SRV4_9CHLR|nr:N-acetyltransferase [Thermosporothrix sp. COM3]